MKIINIILIIAFSLSSEIGKQKSLAVTIYNNQFAMVKDVRSITFQNGTSQLYFTDVSSNIQPETVTFKALSSPESVKVYEQNYEANLINTQAILHKYIQKQIQISSKLGDSSHRIKGILLGYQNGYILKTSYGIQVMNNIESFKFPSLPNDFFTLPTLNWKVFSSNNIISDCQVAYRTSGFSWKSDYSLTLSEDNNTANIGGWVTIDNFSGKKYQNARLKLIAGDVNTVKKQLQTGKIVKKQMKMKKKSLQSAPQFSQKSFSDYHMYTLSQPVTLNDKSQKQVEFIPQVYSINIRKYNLLTINTGYNEQNLKASNKIEFQNTKNNSLGLPLPKGTIRVFKNDASDNCLQFIGEDSINHTPKDQNITLTTGNVIDITANKYQQDRYNFGSNGGYSAILNLIISNHKETSAEIVVEIKNYFGDNLKMYQLMSNGKLIKISSSLYRIVRMFAPNERITYKWSEEYRP